MLEGNLTRSSRLWGPHPRLIILIHYTCQLEFPFSRNGILVQSSGLPSGTCFPIPVEIISNILVSFSSQPISYAIPNVYRFNNTNTPSDGGGKRNPGPFSHPFPDFWLAIFWSDHCPRDYNTIISRRGVRSRSSFSFANARGALRLLNPGQSFPIMPVTPRKA